MVAKAEKNYFLNISLFIIGTVCMITGVFLAIKPQVLMPLIIAIKAKSLHEWTGYLFILLVMFHLFFHFDWVKALTKNVRGNSKKKFAALSIGAITILVCVLIPLLASGHKI